MGAQFFRWSCIRFADIVLLLSAVLTVAFVAPREAVASPQRTAPSIELHLHAGGKPVRMNELGAVRDKKARALAVTRLDLLLSGLSLQRPDGTWIAVPDWHGFLRAEEPLRRTSLPLLPLGEFSGMRFSVGVGPVANHADPNRLRPDDPLHPLVNGMHWGWAGGYVFMAIEGHWQPDNAAAGSLGGFSYHYAGDSNRVRITVPARFTLRAGQVLRLSLDVSTLLSKIDLSVDGDSTHSREPDPIVRTFRRVLPSAFTLTSHGELPVSDPALANGSQSGRAATARMQPYGLSIDARMPSVTFPEDNPLTVAGVRLGEMLFNDRRLSRGDQVSCASCHRAGQAFSDAGRVVSLGVDGRAGERNAMPLFNLAWVKEFFWDGRARSLRQQVLEPIEHPTEMAEKLPRVVTRLAADRVMVAHFQRAFKGGVSADRIALALEQYLLSIVSQDSKFDRVIKGADSFTTEERRGFELFLTEHDPPRGLKGADCFHCHGGSLFTGNRFANNGLVLRGTDTGRERVTGDAADRGKFRTPSLRNVALTAPYMHDGRFQTLEQVIDHYDRGVERTTTLDPNLAKHPARGLGLSASDKSALVAFLQTLTDPALAAGPRSGPAVSRPSLHKTVSPAQQAVENTGAAVRKIRE